MCDMENIEMSNGQRMKQIKESGYKYLGIIQDNEIKTQVMKDKIRTEYSRRVRKRNGKCMQVMCCLLG